MRYEDLKERPIDVLSGVMDFFGRRTEVEILRKAIEQADFSRLQKLEKKKGVVYKDKLKDKESLFFRKGLVGDWRNLFSDSDLEAFWEVSGRAMALAGYEKE